MMPFCRVFWLGFSFSYFCGRVKVANQTPDDETFFLKRLRKRQEVEQGCLILLLLMVLTVVSRSSGFERF